MSYLIVGCGYLGRRLADSWLRAGHEVQATTRRRAEELRAAGIRPVVCDVLDPTTLHSLPAVATVVYCVGFDRSSRVSMRDVYVAGLDQFLAQLPRPERFVYVSSTSVYGQRDGEEVDETSPTEPSDESGRTVLEAEQVVWRHLPEAIVLRFAGIYGPDRLLRPRSDQPLPGDPNRWLNLIHVDDGVSAVRAACERGQPGRIINISDGTPVRRGDYYAELARRLGMPPPVFDPTATSSRDNHRRICNRRMLAELGVALRYP